MSRIVVGVDGSTTSDRALDWAVEDARRRGATIVVVHAWSMPRTDPYVPLALDPGMFEEAGRSVLRAAVERIAAHPEAPPVETVLACESPTRALLEAAAGADLLVVGSHGRGGFSGMLLGSVSQHVLHHATVPVVVVRSGAPDREARGVGNEEEDRR